MVITMNEFSHRRYELNVSDAVSAVFFLRMLGKDHRCFLIQSLVHKTDLVTRVNNE